MNETVSEWLHKAEGDWQAANQLWSDRSYPNYDAVCFHAQQCIEKLMKALLIKNSVVPVYTHKLNSLHSELLRACPEWSANVEELEFLTRGATEFRYPGEDATQNDAESCLNISANLRSLALSLLNKE